MAKLAKNARFLFLTKVLFVVILSLQLNAFAQKDDPAALKVQAKTLIDAQKFTEALPLYEKLTQLTPNDSEAHFYMGFSLLGQALISADSEEKMQLRVRARNEYMRAQQLGNDSELLKGLIEGLPPDGRLGVGYSDNLRANKLMEKGEASFATGKLDEALAHYQNALKIDPLCYHAALFSGDVYTQQNKPDDAGIWYQRAIKINPYIETAYRYSATPLMKQGKYNQARDLYIEAFIVEPYSRLAVSGIIQWAQITKTQVGHPKIDIPEIKSGTDGKANSTINLSPKANDGSLAWASYISTREMWRQAKFAKQFPKEKAYRHTLWEEADALRSVVSSAKAFKPKMLNDQITMLAKMDQDGVLEAFILMAIPDQGIAQDHQGYLLGHRDKLRQYVLNYMIVGQK